MFKPCPNCGFLVALIAGREASQRCPRCGSALVTEAEALDLAADDMPHRRRGEAGPVARGGAVGGDESTLSDASRHTDRRGEPPSHDANDGAALAVPVHEGDAATAGDVDDVPPRDAANMPAAHATPTLETPASPASTLDPSSHPDAVPGATAAAHDGPSFIRRTGTARAGRRWPWIVALLLLSALLALQLLLAQHVELARDAAWRPLVLRACAVLGCDVPPWHAPREYAMVARGVRPDPRRAGVLHVTATVRNDARWPQPPPIVVLSLSDVDGRLVGARAVAPRDYGRAVGALVAPGDSMDIAFDVREPAGHVESFDFQLQ